MQCNIVLSVFPAFLFLFLFLEEKMLEADILLPLLLSSF